MLCEVSGLMQYCHTWVKGFLGYLGAASSRKAVASTAGILSIEIRVLV